MGISLLEIIDVIYRLQEDIIENDISSSLSSFDYHKEASSAKLDLYKAPIKIMDWIFRRSRVQYQDRNTRMGSWEELSRLLLLALSMNI